MSDGHHSFQALGPDFSLQVPVQKVEGARLVLFNYRIARKLGLPIPENPRDLEKVILDLFACIIANAATGDKSWISRSSRADH